MFDLELQETPRHHSARNPSLPQKKKTSVIGIELLTPTILAWLSIRYAWLDGWIVKSTMSASAPAE